MKWLFFCILTIIGAYFYWRYSGTVQKNQPEASSAGKPTQSDDLSTGGALESNPNVSPENSLNKVSHLTHQILTIPEKWVPLKTPTVIALP
ncbi:hypothetical protein EBQ74_12025 [bacterium]|nr:hypothetical protein [bacterium]